MDKSKNKKKKISRSFQFWLLVLVGIAFIATTVFLWIFQTEISEKDTIDLLELNISDVIQDINDASDENMLKISWAIAEEMDLADEITNQFLEELTQKYDVTEINYINENGIIVASTYKDFMNYEMASGTQSAEFLVLLSGSKEYVQSYQPVSYDNTLWRKYGGVILERGGFVQVGYGSQRFQRDIGEFVVGVTRNRHVGENGCIIIVDEEWNIVSDRYGNEGKNLDVTGLYIDTEKINTGKVFIDEIYGKSCYCIYEEAESYKIVAVIPTSEAALSRNVSVGITVIMQVVVFSLLFIMIYILVSRLVVNNIHKINESLSNITEGKLDTVVDVRTHVEFDELSNDINSTVETLKKYILEAETRIDTELAFAKAIQHSALPDVNPNYTKYEEFDIWASMHTAKEVGGDFYDFYFINEDVLAFLIADVSGKGIPAAMFMMTSKTLLKSCAESSMSVDEVFTVANDKLCESNEAGMFVTAWMGYLNIRTGEIAYANAGHNPPLVKRANGKFEYLESVPDLVLAGMDGIPYSRNELKLNPGDVIYLYTDGVTEATNAQEELYGEERLETILNNNSEADLETLCTSIKADIDEFVEDEPQFDDITMLCLKWKGRQ